MRVFVTIIILVNILFIFCSSVSAYYRWYDDKGLVHYTQSEPPSDAKNEDGSKYWATEIDQEERIKIDKLRFKRATLKIKNDSAYVMKNNDTVKKEASQELAEKGPEKDDKNGFSLPTFSLLKLWDSTRVDTGDSTGPLYGVWGSSKDDIFVVGAGEGKPVGNNLFLVRGGIFHYDGHKWNEMSSPDDEFLDGILLHAVWGSSSRDVYAVGSKWTILYYDGFEWSRIESGLFQDTGDSPSGGFWSVWGSSATDIYVVGSSMTRGGVALHFDGDCWRNIYLPKTNETHRQRYHCVWGTSAENVYILGDWGKIYHYNGSAWEEMNIGQSVNFTTIWGTSSDDIFVAGYNGKIFHYDGKEWSEMFEMTDMHFSGIWGNSSQNVYVAGTVVNEGAIYHYDGIKWKKTKSVNGVHLNGIWGHGDVFAVGTGNLILRYSGMSIFTLAFGVLSFGLGIFGWKFIRK